jgi:hypothetical protein
VKTATFNINNINKRLTNLLAWLSRMMLAKRIGVETTMSFVSPSGCENA